MKKVITVIIVNYNVTKEVDNCLNSVLSLYDDYVNVIVIDNNSCDRSIELIQLKYPKVKFILLKDNLGYSKANNLGSEHVDTDYLLFLNPDTIIIEDFISSIIDFIANNSNVGACGPMLLYKDYSFQHSFGIKMGYVYEFMEAFMLINIYRKIFKLINLNRFKDNNPFRVNWLSGACLLIKREIFINANKFDTDYFLNYEDIDLCKKIEDLGYTNYYFPSLKCIHIDQSSQKKNYEKFVMDRYISRLMYSKKHYSKYKSFVIKIFHILGLGLRLLFVNYFYTKYEKSERYNGYKKALKMYLSNG